MPTRTAAGIPRESSGPHLARRLEQIARHVLRERLHGKGVVRSKVDEGLLHFVWVATSRRALEFAGPHGLTVPFLQATSDDACTFGTMRADFRAFGSVSAGNV